jgi:hypothetical protein
LSYKTYPPGHPPPSANVATGNEAGLCEYAFECTTLAHAQFRQRSGKPASVTLDSAEIELTLTITIWTAEGTGPEVRAHEETHREICDRYYQDAETIARRVAQPVLAQPVTITGSDTPVAAEERVRTLQKTIVADVMREIHERCGFAQEVFDRITDHGRAPVTNSDALQRALTEEKTHWQLQLKRQP